MTKLELSLLVHTTELNGVLFMENNKFTWTDFYTEFADKLLPFKNNRGELLKIIKAKYDDLNMRYPFIDETEPVDDICPFTVFGCFNKGITDENRIAIMSTIGKKIGVSADPPKVFLGIPVLNNMRAWFFAYKADRKPEDINNLWSLFESAMTFADNPSPIARSSFIRDYDKVIKQIGIKWNVTMGIYWIRPFSFLNLDEVNRNYLLDSTNPLSADLKIISNLKQLPMAETYLGLIDVCMNYFKKPDGLLKSFPELSYNAWLSKPSDSEEKKVSTASVLKWFGPIIDALRKHGGSGTPEQVREQIIADLNLPAEIVNETRGKLGLKKFDNEVAFARNYLAYEGYIDKSIKGLWKLTEKGLAAKIDMETASDIFIKWQEILRERKEKEGETTTGERIQDEIRFWIFSPGEKSSKWDEFYSKGIMGIGWDEMGDLKQYPSKDAMKTKMKELYGQDFTYVNAAHATWQFANELNPGDIVYAKKGMYKLIGRGVVESDYIFDDTRDEYKHIHKIKWTDNGEWDHPGQAVLKVLTDITAYTDYLEKLEALFIEYAGEEIHGIKEITYPEYTDADFLGEVFLDAERYELLINLLKRKKNIIMQGAPGVGKTYAARRLAYSIMGSRDSSRVMIVQFHQSYSYEDFIMGYRPTKDGFELTPGPFYEFCKKAQDDNERDYFFIIDEINRGNLSKIFGELLMLIENDKRGEKLRLLYSNEQFAVPKNVHIIGMMNTADRSLAIIDYALRRRFAFFDLEPAFDSEGFKAMMTESDHPKYYALVEKIMVLNEFISNDETLGEGFRIGHSYLCLKDDVSDELLRAVIEYEILPLLNEYWFDERSKLEQWTKKLYGVLND
jgi:5-methylcytosine-specific restriction enzyme B